MDNDREQLTFLTGDMQSLRALEERRRLRTNASEIKKSAARRDGEIVAKASRQWKEFKNSPIVVSTDAYTKKWDEVRDQFYKAEKEAMDIRQRAESCRTVILDKQVREIIRNKAKRLVAMGDFDGARMIAVQEADHGLQEEIEAASIGRMKINEPAVTIA
jgi:hypothetical protein